MRRSPLDGAAAALALLSAVAAADDAPFDRRTALETSQAAIGRTLGDHPFVTSDGAPLSLHDLRGRPLAISLVFTSCYHTCPAITQQLATAVATARHTFPDGDLTVLTIGFDTANDTPERMRAYARERGLDTGHWLFLSADAATIDRLADEIGFLFFPSPRGFDHLAQVTVVDPDLRVYHQIYGDSFVPPALIEPLKRLALGAAAESGGVAGLLETVRLLCTVYDPASGKYQLDYSLIIAIGTGLTGLLAVAWFIARAWREHDRPDLPA